MEVQFFLLIIRCDEFLQLVSDLLLFAQIFAPQYNQKFFRFLTRLVFVLDKNAHGRTHVLSPQLSNLRLDSYVVFKLLDVLKLQHCPMLVNETPLGLHFWETHIDLLKVFIFLLALLDMLQHYLEHLCCLNSEQGRIVVDLVVFQDMLIVIRLN